jgi:release factor glutamine methyltransferase
VSSTRSSTRSQLTNASASSALHDTRVGVEVTLESASTWRAVRTEIAARLSRAGIVPAEAEARFLVEHVSGCTADEWPAIADEQPPARASARLGPLVDRRVDGEPLQYVLGAWSFRGLDLMIDRRVLIPRPETEHVVEIVLEEAVRRGLRRVRRRHLNLVDAEPSAVIADLGTGSGAIALALDAELPDVLIWATDASSEALDVARANVAGCAATRVRIAQGSWFDALPESLRGSLELIVSNPPYVAEHEVDALPEEVAGFEPRRALVSGPTGSEAIEHLVANARRWMVPDGVLVCELAPHQAPAMIERARALGYVDAEVRADLAGRPRVLVARAG